MTIVSLTGPEAAGKSTLAAQLAAHFGGGWVPEYARKYLAQHGPAYTLPDLENIARGQLAAEAAAAAALRPGAPLFCDTDLTVIKIWAENAFGTCPQWVESELRRPRYALTLLLAPDLPWTPDPLREHPDPADRWRFYAQYRQTLQALGWPFVEISGSGPERLAQAVAAVAPSLRLARMIVETPLTHHAPSEGLALPRPMLLENNHVRARISARGAELTSLQAASTGLEYLWQADPAHWGRHAPVLFPIVGRLPDDTYLHQGQPYRLGQHGFARDGEFTVLRHSPTQAVLRLTDTPATRASYPFAFELTITYTLQGSTLHVQWEVQNPAPQAELLFSIGAHPAFRCPRQPDEEFADYYFEFDHPVTLARQLLRGGLRSGQTAPVLHQARELPLSYSLFADDALVFGHYDFTRLALRSRRSPAWVRMQFDGFPYLGLWTKGPGAAFVCIEPWQGVASPVGPPQELRDKEGILTLGPGQTFSAAYSIEIG